MTSFSLGDDILVPFPFTDLSTAKKSPAVDGELRALPQAADQHHRDVAATSSTRMSGSRCPAVVSEWKKAGFIKCSVVKTDPRHPGGSPDHQEAGQPRRQGPDVPEAGHRQHPRLTLAHRGIDLPSLRWAEAGGLPSEVRLSAPFGRSVHYRPPSPAASLPPPPAQNRRGNSAGPTPIQTPGGGGGPPSGTGGGGGSFGNLPRPLGSDNYAATGGAAR